MFELVPILRIMQNYLLLYYIHYKSKKFLRKNQSQEQQQQQQPKQHQNHRIRIIYKSMSSYTSSSYCNKLLFLILKLLFITQLTYCINNINNDNNVSIQQKFTDILFIDNNLTSTTSIILTTTGKPIVVNYNIQEQQQQQQQQQQVFNVPKDKSTTTNLSETLKEIFIMTNNKNNNDYNNNDNNSKIIASTSTIDVINTKTNPETSAPDNAVVDSAKINSAPNYNIINIINRDNVLKSFSNNINNNNHNNYNNNNNNDNKVLNSLSTATESKINTIKTNKDYNNNTNNYSNNRSNNSSNSSSKISSSNTRNSSRISSTSSSNCQSCQMREKAKLDNLESIKMHILMRLQLTKLPNITTPISVPNKILENFYKNFSVRGQKNNNNSHKNNNNYNYSNNNSYNYNNNNNNNVNSVPRNINDGYDIDDMQNDDATVYNRYSTHKTNDFDLVYYNYNDSDYDVDDDDQDYEDGDNYNEKEMHADDFYSHVKSIYVLPTIQRIRHNRKSEILNFKFDNNHSTISRTIMHIYLRGIDWIRDHEPLLMEELNNNETLGNRREIVITVHRVLRRSNSFNFTHKIKLIDNINKKIPEGQGQWVQFDIKPLAAQWRDNPNATQDVLIKGLHSWMRPLIVIGDDAQNKPLTAHIEVITKEKFRQKRSTSLDCQESENEVRCCRYPLKVNFTNFGWHFVVAPTSFDAYFCNGECKVGYLEQYTHTHIASLTTSATPCCSPTKMSPLSLLYFNLDQNLVLSIIPNMSVEKCSCS